MSSKCLVRMSAAALAGVLMACGTVRAQAPSGAKGPPMTNQATKTEAEWRKTLTPEQYRVLREKGTERAFSGEYWNTKENGTYCCTGCGAELFTSETKVDSHCGWPSFFAALAKDNIKLQPDDSHGMHRTEVLCARCGGHLGHLFDDGPAPTGQRFCINSVSLKLKKKEPPKKK